MPTILDVVCRTTGMGFAAVARVTEDRWVACSVRDTIDFGLKAGGELPVGTTICSEIREHRRVVAIDDVTTDPDFCAHPTPALYGFRSYISAPITTRDGRFFGTLCAIDPKPAAVNTPETIGMVRMFADLIAFHLDAQDRLESSAHTLKDEREVSELREQFIAILGHDLRNPLAAIDAGARMLSRMPLDAKALAIMPHIQASVARMAGLIDNVLDFAQGRLGGGLSLARQRCDLAPHLLHVVQELQASHPDRAIKANFDLGAPLDCDPGRLSQLLSNLLANALTHGAADQPIAVSGAAGPTTLRIAVSNRGDPLDDKILAQIFQPFVRGRVRDSAQGLGLGLYIASEIATAHGGRLSATSTGDMTTFEFKMPLARSTARA